MRKQTIWISTKDRVELMDVYWSLDSWCELLNADCVEFVRTQFMYDIFGMDFGGMPVMIVDESGYINHKPVNNTASLFYPYGGIYGNVLLAVQRGEDIYPPDDVFEMYVRLCDLLESLGVKQL